MRVLQNSAIQRRTRTPFHNFPPGNVSRRQHLRQQRNLKINACLAVVVTSKATSAQPVPFSRIVRILIR